MGGELWLKILYYLVWNPKVHFFKLKLARERSPFIKLKPLKILFLSRPEVDIVGREHGLSSVQLVSNVNGK